MVRIHYSDQRSSDISAPQKILLTPWSQVVATATLSVGLAFIFWLTMLFPHIADVLDALAYWLRK